MRLLTLSLCLSSLFLVNALAQKPVTAVGQDHFQADFPSGGHVRMHIRSGAMKIMGSDEKDPGPLQREECRPVQGR